VRRNPAAIVLQAVVVTALVGGTTAFVSFDKTVTVSVDGEPREVRTFARTVGDVLEREGIHVDPHDTVAPALSTSVTDGAEIAVRNGRLLTLTVDGKPRGVWVTAESVEEALEQLGLRAEGAYLSVSRSRPIPLAGMALLVRLPHDVTFLADGKRHRLTTTAISVAAALREAGLRLRGRDKVSRPLRAYPADGETIRVTRIRGRNVEKEFDIPFDTVRQPDSSLYKGETRVVQAGVPGLLVKWYRDTYVDGRKTSRKLVRRKVAEQPVTAVIAYGTTPRPTYTASPDGLNWAALAYCESGGNPRAYNPSGPYYGLYQFSLGTWQGVGGSGLPSDASASEQTYRAQLLYRRSGASPWPVCGRYLFS